jgi:peptidoglycan/LPS O-acetylase OafA/YrhL
MQLYVVFPWLVAWFNRHPNLHRPIVITSLGLQLLFTAAVHYRLAAPAPISSWLASPGSWLPSYQLYVIAGVLAALHYQVIFEWLHNHQRVVALATAAAIDVGLGTFLIDIHLIGMTPLHASEVFQPVVVLESLTFAAAELTAGLWLAARASGRRRRLLERGGDLSFGIYLAHPLLLQAATIAGVGAALARLGGATGEAVVLVGVVPLIFLVTAVAVDVVRRTPASVALTGRPARPRRYLTPRETQHDISRPQPSARPRSQAADPATRRGHRLQVAHRPHQFHARPTQLQPSHGLGRFEKFEVAPAQTDRLLPESTRRQLVEMLEELFGHCAIKTLGLVRNAQGE